MGESTYLRTHATEHIEAGGHALHHIRSGSGKPVLLVHGGGMWLYTFRHVIDPLSRVCEVHALDMPGYGYTLTTDHRAAVGCGTMVRALKAYLDARGIRKVSLVGHSWGGGWVLAFTLAWPDMVDRIGLIGSSGLDVPDVFEWRLLRIPVLGEAFLRALTPGMVRRRLTRSFHDTSLVDRDMAMEVYLPLRIPFNRKAQAMISRRLSWKSVEAGLPSLRVPAMLVWGAQDRYLHVSLAQRFREKIHGLRVEIIKDCGHSPHEEQPGPVADLLAGFIVTP